MRRRFAIRRECTKPCFNLRREASPRATISTVEVRTVQFSVSISGEKPVPVRRQSRTDRPPRPCLFQSQARSQSPCDWKHWARWDYYEVVSISGEKPVPVRPVPECTYRPGVRCFNLRREASPRATAITFQAEVRVFEFQSQARSQSPCDSESRTTSTSRMHRFNLRREASPRATKSSTNDDEYTARFQSQARSQSPCDMRSSRVTLPRTTCFNLRREASPRATRLTQAYNLAYTWFQSQARSQSPCDAPTIEASPHP